MARSRDGRNAREAEAAARKRRNRLLSYTIPLVALLLVTIVLAVYLLPQPDRPTKMNFTFQLLIEYGSPNGNSSRAIAPTAPVGESGGFWMTNRFDGYGINRDHYPLYMDDPTTACSSGACTVHVASTVVYNYTLQNYFDVWGQSLGPANTIGRSSAGNYTWEMCTGATSSTITLSNAWGSQPLTANLAITLLYYDTFSGIECGSSAV